MKKVLIILLIAITLLMLECAFRHYVLSPHDGDNDAVKGKGEKELLEQQILDTQDRIEEKQRLQHALDEYERRKQGNANLLIGSVLKVDGDSGRVTVSAGSAIGINVGDEYLVYRGESLICTIKVVIVNESSSEAELIGVDEVEPPAIEVGDIVRKER